jgi:hypothetical protein
VKQFLKTQESPLEEFDGNMFWRLIEKVQVESVVEAIFVFKTGVEVNEIFMNSFFIWGLRYIMVIDGMSLRYPAIGLVIFDIYIVVAYMM